MVLTDDLIRDLTTEKSKEAKLRPKEATLHPLDNDVAHEIVEGKWWRHDLKSPNVSGGYFFTNRNATIEKEEWAGLAEGCVLEIVETGEQFDVMVTGQPRFPGWYYLKIRH